ncbi:small ribosomal subunit biogenesis GTPase RsgA [Legionella septentrionalis]|uniref:small ribosomal subunit biogenesis GTPase RsgA n=1 Tax=Legionella septentrionalis TaxID=2498109 RepID=UPI000F8EE749|nr:small ribosomal subunit biogenesis GTPase RsgA [Legionella septentrionalis]RUR10786.1 small ribosomal subunit biogenesis GTPase RsgA [Legionella septentrionalis]
MSKRRISKQQSDRIEKKQQSYHEPASEYNTSINEGLVLTCFGRHALVEDSNKHTMHCSIRANLATLVAGDRVLWQAEGAQQGVIVSLSPRTSVLGRPDKHGSIRPVAANITQLMIVVAPKPLISWPLLDSYLIIAEHLNLNACIVLNKTDLGIADIEMPLSHYQSLGYTVLHTSFSKPQSYKALLAALNHETSVFVGQSGVGKSSLIAKILPEETNIQTASISQVELGRHTTSNSYFYHLPSGGALIDSPGVREFGLWHMPAAEIAKGYREFRPYLSQCKFRNCNHQNTPDCALIEAVKQGEIQRDRYHNYVKISSQFAK